MIRTLRHLWHINRELLVMLGIVSITGAINFFVVNQRAFLNFYYLPVVLGAYLLGKRQGVFSAVLACAIVVSLALMNEGTFAANDGALWMRWLDIGTWGGFLILTSYLVGTLYEQKEAQLRELHDAYRGILEILFKLLDTVDPTTKDHSRRVSEYAVEMARAMGLDENEVEDVRVGAFLHDIGKVDVTMDVLHKAAGLDPTEFGEMKRHVDSGVSLVRTMGGILRHVIPLVAYHHERWDGTGYKNLKGEAIPLGARIIAVADTFDAIVSDRPYRRGKSHPQAVQIIREEAGRQFDPAVVRVFLSLYEVEGPTIRLDDRQAA